MMVAFIAQSVVSADAFIAAAGSAPPMSSADHATDAQTPSANPTAPTARDLSMRTSLQEFAGDYTGDGQQVNEIADATTAG
jgi:hypothetical protein